MGAKEIAQGNKNNWFAYSPLLHRVREAGTLCKLLDSIDEKTLDPREVRHLAELLSGSTDSFHGLDDRSFIAHIQKIVHNTSPMYDALTGQTRPILHIGRLRQAMKVGFRGNLIPLICCSC